MNTPRYIMDKINFLNKKLEQAGLSKKKIYLMQEIDFILEGRSAYNILINAYWGNFNPMDGYFYLNEFGYLCSVEDTEIEEKLGSMYATLEGKQK